MFNIVQSSRFGTNVLKFMSKVYFVVIKSVNILHVAFPSYSKISELLGDFSSMNCAITSPTITKGKGG